MFEQSMVLEQTGSRKSWSLAVSLLLQVFLLCVLAVLPLLFTNRLPVAQLSSLFVLPALPPVAAAPPEPVDAARPVRRSRPVATNQFVAPSFIPKQVADIVDDFVLSDSLQTISRLATAGGMVPASSLGNLGILGDFNSAPAAAPPPPPAEASKPKSPERIKLGGEVVEAKAIYRPAPAYPALARQARIQGVVELQAIIGTDGHVRDLHVNSGHPLLVREAMAAVSQWRYSPTFLNGDPVEVITQIRVSFSLR